MVGVLKIWHMKFSRDEQIEQFRFYSNLCYNKCFIKAFVSSDALVINTLSTLKPKDFIFDAV